MTQLVYPVQTGHHPTLDFPLFVYPTAWMETSQVKQILLDLALYPLQVVEVDCNFGVHVALMLTTDCKQKKCGTNAVETLFKYPYPFCLGFPRKNLHIPQDQHVKAWSRTE